MGENWEGVPDTSEHRTAGGRAWCFNDSEWCYPHSLCQCCDVSRVPQRWKGCYAGEVLADLRTEVKALHGQAPSDYWDDALDAVVGLLNGEESS